jgi:lipopolysaccharide/colanic/teichoic acid biosynthesis glycosyltransferase
MAAVADVQVAQLVDVQGAAVSNDRSQLLEEHLGRALVASKRKRLFDVVIAATGLVILVPLFVLVGLAVVIDGGWPPLYPHQRIGLDGRPFTLWKFRTMVRRAHAMREHLLPLNESSFPAFKIRRDPRLTRLGRLLRRSSLDELPQLWNVLMGEMSLVGPRPPLPEEVRYYDAVAMGRLSARPGITCTWQVENRDSVRITFDEWVRKDLAYMENWTLRRDVVLVLRTLRAAAKMSGQ